MLKTYFVGVRVIIRYVKNEIKLLIIYVIVKLTILRSYFHLIQGAPQNQIFSVSGIISDLVIKILTIAIIVILEIKRD